MKTSSYILAQMLGCKDALDVEKLDSIVYDPEYFEDIGMFSMESIGEAVHQHALDALMDSVNEARDIFKSHKDEYAASVLGWDIDLVSDALEFIDPKKDLKWGYSSTVYYMELDYWDIYMSVVETLLEDYGNKNLSLKYVMNDYTKDFYGGKEIPEKYASLLL